MEYVMSKYVITEGIESVWHYHISLKSKTTRSLCGKRSMVTNLPIKSWGVVTDHIKERYCSDCIKLMTEEKES